MPEDAVVDLSNVSITPRSNESLGRNRIDPIELLHRHAQGDWGEVSEAERFNNDLALRTKQGEVRSIYRLPDMTLVEIVTYWGMLTVVGMVDEV